MQVADTAGGALARGEPVDAAMRWAHAAAALLLTRHGAIS